MLMRGIVPAEMNDQVATHPKSERIPVAVLLSGGGRTLANLAERAATGELAIDIRIVISSRADVLGVERARNLGSPGQVVPRKAYKTPAEFSDVVWGHVRDAGARLVCLAGFLSLIAVPDDFEHAVINIHPALLPSFGGPGMFGHHVHEAVLAHGCKVSGCTVHFCDQAYDTGPIIIQRTCPVLDDDTPDTLAARVFEQETIAYTEAVRLWTTGRIRVVGHRTVVTP